MAGKKGGKDIITAQIAEGNIRYFYSFSQTQKKNSLIINREMQKTLEFFRSFLAKNESFIRLRRHWSSATTDVLRKTVANDGTLFVFVADGEDK